MKLAYIIFLCCGMLFSSKFYGQVESKNYEKIFSKINTKEGTRDITLINNLGKNYGARVTFPKNQDLPNRLIIALHWAGGSEAYKEFHDCLILPGLKELNAIVISPEGEKQLWSTTTNNDKILAIVKFAKKYWNIDARKVAVTGYSNGGNGSWHFAQNHSAIFSAGIPIASSFLSKEKIKIPLYVIHGKNDELFPVENTIKHVEKAQKKGSDITLEINDTLSHFDACSYTNNLINARHWLEKIWTKE